MIIKLTRTQVKLLKPFYEAVWVDGYPCMIVAQIAREAPEEMRVGFVPKEKAKKLQHVAIDDLEKLPRAQADCRCIRNDHNTRFNINCPVHGKTP